MNTTSPSCGACSSWWRLPLLLAVVLVAVWMLRDTGIQESAQSESAVPKTAPATATTRQTVSLVIDYGNGRRTEFEPIAWRQGMTVQDLTVETPRRDMRMKTLGSGESAFLASLDGIDNEGSDGRNWTYSVGGKKGDRSFGVFELQPGDQVLWTYGDRQ